MRDLFETVKEGDIDARFKRVRDRAGTKDDIELFDASILYRFMDRVYKNEPVEPWILSFLADAFMKVINGGDWEDEIVLPNHPQREIRTRREQRDLNIFCDVENLRRAGTAPTAAISNVAADYSVSYETARGAYYECRKWLLQKI